MWLLKSLLYESSILSVTVLLPSSLSIHSKSPAEILWFWFKRLRSLSEVNFSSAVNSSSNFILVVCRALGVTLWELFENAARPYSHLSDRDVLNHVIKNQQVKLFKPQLELPYSERW